MSGLRLMLVAIGCWIPWTIAISATPDTGEIEKLIKQLGDEKFARREAACKALEQIGAPALDPLRRACGDDDPEVQRRAKDLVRAIERRMEREEILRPTLVRLDLKDASVPDAVAELAKQAGYSILLGGDAAKLQPDLKLTLQTKEMPFWEALDLLCLKAGLTHVVNPQNVRVQHPGNPVGSVRVPNAVSSQSGTAIVLAPGAPPRYPTFYAGALRLRLLPPGAVNLPGISEESPGETVMTLEICLEPKLLGHEVLDVNVVKALDDRNQPLAPVLKPAKQPTAGPEEQQVVIRNGNQVVIRQWIVNRGSIPSDILALENTPRLIPLRFKLPDQPGQVLADLQATLAAQVRTPVMPLLTVENIMEAIGKEIAGRDGVSATISSCTVGRVGEVTVAMRLAPNALMLAGLNPNVPVQIVPNQQMPLNAVRMGLASAGATTFTLTDTDGNPYQLVGTQYTQVFGPPNNISLDYRLIFRPQNPKAQPQRLTISASRVAAIELPFAMHNIPLIESH
ncbi:MAG: HEAT repeat domain-containing protein [Gemmatales bacterium]|nr:HEAT repeat domain-containing protein [Gemmatales bacterium]MDW8385500.1 HEAT repeat domain-containing protein [Gemmatales bacterium]